MGCLEDWVELLAHVYNRVQWWKIKGRSSYDVFAHRVEFSVNKRTPSEFFQRLCNSLGLQAPSVPVELLDRLEEQEDAMKVIRKKAKYIVLKAAKRAKELREEKKRERENQQKLEVEDEGSAA